MIIQFNFEINKQIPSVKVYIHFFGGPYIALTKETRRQDKYNMDRGQRHLEANTEAATTQCGLSRHRKRRRSKEEEAREDQKDGGRTNALCGY
jgi:hypothetical protein